MNKLLCVNLQCRPLTSIHINYLAESSIVQEQQFYGQLKRMSPDKASRSIRMMGSGMVLITSFPVAWPPTIGSASAADQRAGRCTHSTTNLLSIVCRLIDVDYIFDVCTGIRVCPRHSRDDEIVSIIAD